MVRLAWIKKDRPRGHLLSGKKPITWEESASYLNPLEARLSISVPISMHWTLKTQVAKHQSNQTFKKFRERGKLVTM